MKATICTTLRACCTPKVGVSAEWSTDISLYRSDEVINKMNSLTYLSCQSSCAQLLNEISTE